MERIRELFDTRFAHWDIQLPAEAWSRRQRGKIVQRGWAIWYLFDRDEKGEYMDYYASHRMTDDSHVRLYADGTLEDLPAISEFRLVSEDRDEDARLEAEYLAENRRVARLLAEKGFGLEGDEPGGVQINRFLHLGDG